MTRCFALRAGMASTAVRLGMRKVEPALRDIVFEMDGELPINTDGGLKSFGHPVGASGLRMVYEIYKQLQGKAGERQLANVELGMAHNLGGPPQVCSVAIVGR